MASKHTHMYAIQFFLYTYKGMWKLKDDALDGRVDDVEEEE